MQSTRAGKTASSSMPAVTPGPSSARVKPEPGTASAAAEAGGPPSTGARQREPGSKSKRTGGSRDGYAVRQSVLDDDWEDELEDEAEDLSECLTDKPFAYVAVTDLGACACALQLLNKIARQSLCKKIKILPCFTMQVQLGTAITLMSPV